MSAATHRKHKRIKQKIQAMAAAPQTGPLATRRFLGLAGIWRFNCILAFLYLFVASGFPFLQSSVFEYSNVSSDPFDGTTAPIAYVPNWLETKNTNKSLVFADIDISEFQELPKYNISILDDDSGKNSNALQMRYTYPVVYMGSYRGNYKEYDGSHVGVDIRAPIGTPVLAIANGVVVKTKFDETGDGKYIVIRHENVVFGGESQTLYSSYLHLAEIAVEEGQKISKGAVIGKVGMTGITTTPHLHFQIDTKLSPFHPYWPFTFLEAKKANVDFFEAINIGLWKESALKNTIHPIDFVQNNTSPKLLVLSNTPERVNDVPTPVTSATPPTALSTNIEAPLVVQTEPKNDAQTSASSGAIPTTKSETTAWNVPAITSVIKSENMPQNSVTSSPGSAIPDPDLIVIEKSGSSLFVQSSTTKTGALIENASVSNTNYSASLADDKPIFSPTYGEEKLSEDMGEIIFRDIAPSSFYYNASRYLALNKISVWYEDNTFRPEVAVTRAEGLAMIMRFFRIQATPDKKNSFRDVKTNTWIKAYIDTAIQKKIITANVYFRPQDMMTRAEFITILMRASKLPISTTIKNSFQDLRKTSAHTIYINNFTHFLGVRGRSFEPNKKITRGDIANIIYSFSHKYQQ